MKQVLLFQPGYDSKLMHTLSVIMPVYNGARYLREAIDSILNQTYSNFEFIIINDGSTDSSEHIITSYSDSRIRYFKNETNIGLPKSLNKGVRAAEGSYIARMDGDDISLPRRLEAQLDFLLHNPTVEIVGSSIRIIDEHGRMGRVLHRSKGQTAIKWSSLFSTPLFHPSVMGRASVFKSNLYNELYPNSEDYELWSRLLFKKDTVMDNLQEVLLYYRSYSKSFTKKLSGTQRGASAENTISNLGNYISLDIRDKKVITSLKCGQIISVNEILRVFVIYLRAAAIFTKVEKANIGQSFTIYLKLVDLTLSLAKNLLRSTLSLFPGK